MRQDCLWREKGIVIGWGELSCILFVLVEFLNYLHVLLFQVKG